MFSIFLQNVEHIVASRNCHQNLNISTLNSSVDRGDAWGARASLEFIGLRKERWKIHITASTPGFEKLSLALSQSACILQGLQICI